MPNQRSPLKTMIGCYLTAEQIRRMDYLSRDLKLDRTATIIHLVNTAYEAARTARRRKPPTLPH